MMPTVLERAELFRSLDRPTLDGLVDKAASWPVARNQNLLKQGDDPDHLFLVAEGRLKMTVLSKDGMQTTLGYMEAGDVIGCAAFFRRFPYPATATAVVDSIVLAWTAAEFEQLLRRCPQLALNALALVGGRAEHMLQRLLALTTKGIEQRLADALLRLHAHGEAHRHPDGSATIRTTRQDLAELTDVTIYTISRTISAWARAGIISAGRGNITIQDVARLTQMAEGARDA